MTSRQNLRWIAIFGLSSALTYSACGQGEGGPCQVTSDCESALTCCKRGGGVSDRGTCGRTCTGGDTALDGSVEVDGSAGDASVDAAEDAAQHDAQPSDGASDGRTDSAI